VGLAAVNAEHAPAWNGASGRYFTQQSERMRGRLTARLLGAAMLIGRDLLGYRFGAGAAAQSWAACTVPVL